MASRFVRPDTTILQISNGDTLTVRRRLTAGEHRARFTRMSMAGVDGGLTVNRMQIGLATITAYLLDWSLTDEAGTLVKIRGLSIDDLTQVLDNLDPDSFREIREAIETHEAAMTAEREVEKNGQGGESKSSATSPSPSITAGVTNG